MTASRVPGEGGRAAWPVAASHSRTVLSSLPEARRLAVGAEGHGVDRVACARRGSRRGPGRWRRPTAAPSCRRCREARVLPSGLKATALDRAGVPVRAGRAAWPVAASHSRTVLS